MSLDWLKSQTRKGFRKVKGVRNKFRASDQNLHFLHVGKAAGTQIVNVMEHIKSETSLYPISHPHSIGLADLPEGERYFFSTRDPATRYYSSFYSRKRQGRPHYDNPWSPNEAIAFGNFPEANDLAEALFEEGQRGRQATAAIRSIRHTARNLVDWVRFEGHLFDRRPPVWVVRQERFASDLNILLRRLDCSEAVKIDMERRSHTNDYSETPPLSDKALENLRAWYVQDYAFLDLCESWIVENGGEPTKGHST